MAKHKHAELIKAWADGAKIQGRSSGKYQDTPRPQWHENWEYRIKPEPKPDFVEKRTIFYNESFKTVDIFEHPLCLTRAVPVAFTFDGETGMLKAVELFKKVEIV